MKGISQTLWIVVAAVVIIVVALVVLTIFGTNIQNVASVSEAKSVCRQLCATAMASGICPEGAAPAMWYAKSIKYNNLPASCWDIETEVNDPNFHCKCPKKS